MMAIQKETEEVSRFQNDGILAQGYGLAPMSVLSDPDLIQDAKLVYCLLSAFARQDGQAFPSVRTICKKLQMASKTVQRAVVLLEKTGYVKKQRRESATKGNISSLYILNAVKAPCIPREHTPVFHGNTPLYSTGKRTNSSITTNSLQSVGAQKSAPMKSGELPEEIRALILKWNAGAATPGLLVKPSRHNLDRPSQTLQDISVFISALRSGTVLQRYRDLTPAWLAAENIPAAMLEKKWTPAEIEAVMQDYLLCFQEGYWPYTAAEKQRLPKGMNAFLFSPRAPKRKSVFFYLAAHPPKKKDAVQSPETFKVCVQLFTKYNHAPTPIEKQQLAGAANELFREYQQIDKGIIPYCSPTYFERAGSLQKFLGMFSDFLEYLFQNDRDGMQMAAGMLRPGTKTWEAFLRYTEQEFNCPLSLWGVDPEAWAKGRFPLVLMFMRDKVREIGMDRARRRYGNRIPFMTFEEQTAYAERWKTKHGGRMPLAGEWGRGLYREIMKGEK